jgi:hypothetical protein
VSSKGRFWANARRKILLLLLLGIWDINHQNTLKNLEEEYTL